MITISTVSSDPAFVLSRPQRTVSASSGATTFRSAHDAVTALRSGRISHIVGALPFTPGAPTALWAPDSVTVTDAPYLPRPDVALPDFELDEAVPAPTEHLDRVAAAVELLGDPTRPVRKVVLARALRAVSSDPVRPLGVLELMVGSDPESNGFMVDLSAAGGRYSTRHLVGASPEVLVRRTGNEVLSHPLAGSAGRILDDPEADRRAGAALLTSAKDQTEHRYVVDQVASVLDGRCADVVVSAPEVTSTPAMWHLGTPISATVPAAGPTALELALALHPTPAVCGTPTADAARLIAELEGERGFYAGAVGWCDADGNGEWMVSIRCAELSDDGTTLLAHAGGGIVAASDPAAELAETTAKFQRILGPLGISDLPVTVG